MAQLRLDYHKFKQKNAEVITVWPEDIETLKPFWKKRDYPFIGLPDPQHKVADSYNQQVKLTKLGRMPAMMLIDKNSTIRYRHYGNSMRDIPPNREVLALLDKLNH